MLTYLYIGPSYTLETLGQCRSLEEATEDFLQGIPPVQRPTHTRVRNPLAELDPLAEHIYSDPYLSRVFPLAQLTHQPTVGEFTRTGNTDMARLLNQTDQTPISLLKSHQALVERAREQSLDLCIDRLFDVDSIWLHPRSLKAFSCSPFALSSFPDFGTSFISHSVPFQPLQLGPSGRAQARRTAPYNAKTLLLGMPSCLAGFSCRVYIVFPNMPQSRPRAPMQQSHQQLIYDNAILPALQKAVPPEVYQKHHQSYEKGAAKAAFSKETVHSADTERPANIWPLRGTIPAASLNVFWCRFCHCIGQLSSPAAGHDFTGFYLLAQAHGLKDALCGQTLDAVKRVFSQLILNTLDPTQLRLGHCWLDFGWRDTPYLAARPPSSPDEARAQARVRGPAAPPASAQALPLTPIWQAQALQPVIPPAITDRLGWNSTSTLFHSYGLAEAGSVDVQARGTARKVSSFGLCHIKAYNNHKDHLYVPNRDHAPFADTRFEVSALSQASLDYLAESSLRAGPKMKQSAQAIRKAFTACKKHTVVGLSPARPGSGPDAPAAPYTPNSLRTEVTIRLTTFLSLDLQGIQHGRRWVPLQEPGPLPRFFVMPTETLNKFILASSNRFLYAIELHQALALKNSTATLERPRVDVVGNALSQIYTAKSIAVLLQFLRFSLDSRHIARQSWIWLDRFGKSPDDARQSDPEEDLADGGPDTGHGGGLAPAEPALRLRGLGLKRSFQLLGALFLPPEHFSFDSPVVLKGGGKTLTMPRIHLYRNPTRGGQPPVGRHFSDPDVWFSNIFRSLLSRPGACSSAGNPPYAAFILAAQWVAQAYNLTIFRKMQADINKLPKSAQPIADPGGAPPNVLEVIGHSCSPWTGGPDIPDYAAATEIISIRHIHQIWAAVLAWIGQRHLAGSTFWSQVSEDFQPISQVYPYIRMVRASDRWNQEAAKLMRDQPCGVLEAQPFRTRLKTVRSILHSVAPALENPFNEFLSQHFGSFLWLMVDASEKKFMDTTRAPGYASLPGFFRLCFRVPSIPYINGWREIAKVQDDAIVSSLMSIPRPSGKPDPWFSSSQPRAILPATPPADRDDEACALYERMRQTPPHFKDPNQAVGCWRQAATSFHRYTTYTSEKHRQWGWLDLHALRATQYGDKIPTNGLPLLHPDVFSSVEPTDDSPTWRHWARHLQPSTGPSAWNITVGAQPQQQEAGPGYVPNSLAFLRTCYIASLEPGYDSTALHHSIEQEAAAIEKRILGL